MKGWGLKLSDSGWKEVAGYCEHDYGSSCPVICGESLG